MPRDQSLKDVMCSDIIWTRIQYGGVVVSCLVCFSYCLKPQFDAR